MSNSYSDFFESNSPEVKLLWGNCLEKMKEFNDCSVDTIITDPPYGLSFMGKKWDYEVPSVEIWEECLRVLKPGGTALIFAGSRTQHRMAVNVEDAGFILKDTMMWMYGSGFPKATDISKQLDKTLGKEPKIVGISPNWGESKKDREKDNKMEVRGKNAGLLTEPTTPEAKEWEGWKSHGLKPAYEPIIVAMKPNEGTYANNALIHGVSGLNIDDSRIPLQKCDDTQLRTINRNKRLSNDNNQKWGMTKNNGGSSQVIQSSGRYPTNIILDEEVGEILDEQTDVLKSGVMKKGNGKSEGGVSRFFYCAKVSKKERNMGCDDLPDSLPNSDDFTNLPSSRSNSINTSSGKLRKVLPNKNNHPTVKPLKLMEYLCTLTSTPTGGVVLDPFMGSGTTGIACKNTKREFIGIEMNEEFFEISKRRINH